MLRGYTERLPNKRVAGRPRPGASVNWDDDLPEVTDALADSF